MNYQKLARRKVWATSKDQNLADCPPKIVEAREALSRFAARELGLSLGSRRWDTRLEVMDVFTPDGLERSVQVAVLDLMQAPRVILGIALESPREFTAWIMRERAAQDRNEPEGSLTWKPVQAIILPAEMKHLKALLEKLLGAGVITKTAEGLRFTGKRPSFRGPTLMGR